MRIVAGEYGSRKIKTLKGKHTRPTSSKVRAAIFDHYGSYFEGGYFLDLFAGSGAMGLEALSRGFEHASFIEKDSKALRVVQENIELLQVSDKASLYRGDALSQMAKLAHRYDLIFIDPPYAYPHAEKLLKEIIALEVLAPNAYCVFETNQVLKEEYADLKCYQYKEYGDTKVYFYQRA